MSNSRLSISVAGAALMLLIALAAACVLAPSAYGAANPSRLQVGMFFTSATDTTDTVYVSFDGESGDLSLRLAPRIASGNVMPDWIRHLIDPLAGRLRT